MTLRNNLRVLIKTVALNKLSLTYQSKELEHVPCYITIKFCSQLSTIKVTLLSAHI